MEKIKFFRGAHASTDFHASRAFMIAPVIKKEYFQRHGDKRVRMYLTVEGKKFLADVYDRVFLPAVHFTVRPKNFRHHSLDTRIVY